MIHKRTKKSGEKSTMGMHRPTFYGTTMVGERGQAVIPAEAREALKLKKGDKLLVFGMGTGMLSLTTSSHLEKFAAQMSKRVMMMEGILKKNK